MSLFAVRKGNDDLREQMNRFLSDIEDDMPIS